MSKKLSDHTHKMKIWELVRDIKKTSGYVHGTTLKGESTYIQMIYSLKNKTFDYTVQITNTPCHFGGSRSWFKCPFRALKKACGRRVAILYGIDGQYACRHCHNLSYSSRNLSGKVKAFGSVVSYPNLESSLKRFFYRNKATKKYSRYLKIETKASRGYLGRLGMIENKIKKFKDKHPNLGGFQKDI